MAYDAFISYSHKDRALRAELDTHLSNLKRQGLIDVWHDGHILPGSEGEKGIMNHLSSAKVILLLISADFMASDFCYSTEMKQAIARHDAGDACVIPIILRPCDWEGAPFSKLLALPTDGRAVTQWPSHDEAFRDVVRGIRRKIEALETATKKEENLPPPGANAKGTEPLFLDIALRPQDLEADLSNLRDTRWYRYDSNRLQVRINNQDFCTKVIEIAQKTAHLIETDENAAPANIRPALLRQIKQCSGLFPLCLPLYWENFSELLTRLLRESFSSFGQKLSTVDVVEKSLKHTFEYAHYELASYLCSAIFPDFARKFGYPAIASYIEKYLDYYREGDNETVLAKIFNEQQPLIAVEIRGRRDHKVRGERLYLPGSLCIDRTELYFQPEVSQIIDLYSWFVYCAPQILVSTLMSATFADGIIIAELDYTPGLSRDDYDIIGNP